MIRPLKRLAQRFRRDRLIIDLSDEDSERLRKLICVEDEKLERKPKRLTLIFRGLALLAAIAVCVALYVWRLNR